MVQYLVHSPMARLARKLTGLLSLSVAVAHLPVLGQSPAAGGQGTTLPAEPVLTSIPSARPVTGPGAVFEGVIMDLPEGNDLEHFGYVMDEFFVSGEAQAAPYTTRVLVRRPSDRNRQSGTVVAEAMHPSGNSWMFHFTHTYVMSAGHVAVEIVTTGLEHLQAFNPERYGELTVQPNQANEIIAQVGAMLRSSNAALAGEETRNLILMGTSASAGILLRYLPAHAVYRLGDLSPIYDGFLPTSNIGTVPSIDVPVIQIPTMTEIETLAPDTERRPDGDRPGDQFRTYEFAGMSHNDARFNRTYDPNPCMYPLSRFPLGAFMAVGLDHLISWVEESAVPPHGDRLRLDHNDTDGSPLALDAYGNVTGGIRNTYVDVPLVAYGVRNRGAEPAIANPSRLIAARPEGTANQLCNLAGYETALSQDDLNSLYSGNAEYREMVETRLDELTSEGWFLPVYRDLVLADARAAELD